MPMDLLLCWLFAPLALLVATVGLSLLIERLCGLELEWGLRPALGMAAVIVLAQFGTLWEPTAPLILPATLVLAGVGLVLGRVWRLPRPRPAQIVIPVAVIALLAMPFVISGQATWAGYLKIDDASTLMGITDHAFEHGRQLPPAAPSTHQIVLNMYLGKGYPIGGFVTAKMLSVISGRDIAFTLSPAIAFSVAALALVLFELIRRPLASDAAAAAIAILATLSATLLGYYLWSESKELAAAALVALGPALAMPAERTGWPPRSFIPFGVAAGAMIGVLGPGGAIWILPTLLPIGVVLARRRGRHLAFELGGRLAVMTLLLAIPVLVTPEGIFNPLDKVLTEGSEVNVLKDPLNPLQVSGLWPSTDFRGHPHLESLVVVLAALCIALAAVAIVVCARRRERDGLAFAAYVGGVAAGGALIMLIGSPWVDGKAMATLSPAVLAAALVALALAARRRGWRVPAIATAGVIAAVIVWGAFLAYQGAALAPKDQYDELEQIGEQFAGEGPALDINTSYYGPRHFLDELDPDSTTDFHPRAFVLADGQLAGPKGDIIDIDQLHPDMLERYRLLVLPRGPGTGRPPPAYELAFRGDYYEVWRRDPDKPLPSAVFPLGVSLDAGGTPRCDSVRLFSQEAGAGGMLVAAPVTQPLPVELGTAQMPDSWNALGTAVIVADGPGEVTVRTNTPAGSYDLVLGGEAYSRVDVSIDGREVASRRGAISPTNDYTPLATVDLDRGTHEISFSYDGADLHPGSAGRARPLGPLMLVPVSDRETATVDVDPADYHRLCRHRWDWIEAYRN